MRQLPIALRKIVNRVRKSKEKIREPRVIKLENLRSITDEELEKDIYIAIELGFTA